MIKRQEYDGAAFRKAAKGKRKRFTTTYFDGNLKKYVEREAKGVIIGDIGLEWRRNARGALRWHPTHIPTGICFENDCILDSDMYEAYVAGLSRVNHLSENPEIASGMAGKRMADAPAGQPKTKGA